MYNGRDYSVIGSALTLAASTTLPQMGITGGTTVRPAIYEFSIGSSGSPANQAASFLFQRATTAGTTTGFTPIALDPNDPASTTTAGVTWTVGPTLTANAYLYRFGLNQQATFRWIAATGSEMKVPATANNGIMLLTPAVSTAWAMEATILFCE